jgi:hypothetical protein
VPFDFGGVLPTEHLQRGNIGHVLMHDVGNLRPGQTHLPRRGAPDALERHLLDWPPATEVGQRWHLHYQGTPWPWRGFLLLGSLGRGFLPGLCRGRHRASLYIPLGGR